MESEKYVWLEWEKKMTWEKLKNNVKRRRKNEKCQKQKWKGKTYKGRM